jgi:uncharacterized protein
MTQSAEFLQSIRDDDREQFARLLVADPKLGAAKDANGTSALLLTVYHGRREMSARLLELKVPVDFFEACAAGLSNDVGRLLREQPGNLRQRSHDGWTGLHLAVFFGHRELAALLLDQGADALAVSENEEGALPIRSAAAGDHAGVVRLLIERGCPADARSGAGDYTALHVAAGAGNLELVRLLLEAGADAQLTNGDGENAYDLARKGSHAAVLELLNRSR